MIDKIIKHTLDGLKVRFNKTRLYMLEIIAILALIGALALLAVLSYIDLKDGLLPNELVLGLAACGLVFHLCTLFEFLSLQEMALGAFIGGGMLFFIRGIANYYYQEETLGLGDVKLLAAAGLWLGPEYVLIGLTAGALAGFFHGLAVALTTVKNAQVPMDLNRLSVPAGPGFAIGIIGTAIYMLRDLPQVLF